MSDTMEKENNMDAVLLESLKENKDQIKAAVTKQLIERITAQYRYNIPESIQKEVDAFVLEEVLPEIRKQLALNKDAIVEGATAVALTVGSEVAKAVQAQIAKNMASSYNVQKVFEALIRWSTTNPETTMAELEYWVECSTAIRTDKPMNYGVWHFSKTAGRECVHKFSVHRDGGAEVALYLANTLRDDLNAGIQ
jgi:hypothetical protein